MIKFNAIEKPGVQTPWLAVNQVLAPDERFEAVSHDWKGFLLAPRYSSQLAALLFILHREGIEFGVQGRGTRFRPDTKHPVTISTRAFSQIIWHDQGVIEAGAGCSLCNLHQFLYENGQETPLEGDPLSSTKRSIGGVILSGRYGGIRFRDESVLTTILGVELVTKQGSQIKWGWAFRSIQGGLALHKLLWGFGAFPGIIVKVNLKTTPIPSARLCLSWTFRHSEALWEQFHQLENFTSNWEYLDAVISGRANDQGFVFAQISGLPEEMEAFTRLCPSYSTACQQGERENLKNFLCRQNLKSYFVGLRHHLVSGEYLWVQRWSQGAWWLTNRECQNLPSSQPIWKERFCSSFFS
jgi:FAD/FMN-containing dehydrogenase